MLPTAFYSFVAAVLLCDMAGYGHQVHGLVIATALFALLRCLPPRAWEHVWIGLVAFSLCMAALALAQYAIGHVERPQAVFRSPNFLGAFAALMVFAALLLGGRPIFAAIGAGANFGAVLLSQSRGAMLAVTAGFAVLAIRRNARMSWLAVAAGGALGVLLWDRGISGERLGLWRLAWYAWLQRPVTGWGMGGVLFGGATAAYSTPLEWAVAAGIIGLCFGLWLLCEATRAAWRTDAALAFLAAWLVQGIFLFTIPATGLLLVALLAYIAANAAMPSAARTPAMPQIAPNPAGNGRHISTPG